MMKVRWWSIGAMSLLSSALGCAASGDVSALADASDTNPTHDAGGDAGERPHPDASARDAAADASPITDAGADTGTIDDRCTPKINPARILFIGNSFTHTANMPQIFRTLAGAGGYSPATVDMRAPGGQTLEGHRADRSAEGAPARIEEGWDVVVLQEFSTRPTDAVGPAARFEEDAIDFHDRVVARSPEARVILYETFARHPNHPLYPGTFPNATEMQRQLTYWYHRVGEESIPSRAEQPVRVEIAHVGDAWQRALQDSATPRLHGADDYHPSEAGAYLTALVFFGTIYQKSTLGLPAISVSATEASGLQAVADSITGQSAAPPAIACPRPFAPGDTIRLDFGPLAVSGWNTIAELSATVGPLFSASGALTAVTARTSGFSGDQIGGATDNTLGYPGDVSRDSLWVGSFDGHQAARLLRAELELAGLDEGRYELSIFASRDGRDEGDIGRLTRYTLAGQTRDLEIADNRSNIVTFTAPTVEGKLRLTVEISPAGSGRFAYLGSVILKRLE